MLMSARGTRQTKSIPRNEVEIQLVIIAKDVGTKRKRSRFGLNLKTCMPYVLVWVESI
jgi:hypothetical protein